jgi:hypothetical protein
MFSSYWKVYYMVATQCDDAALRIGVYKFGKVLCLVWLHLQESDIVLGQYSVPYALKFLLQFLWRKGFQYIHFCCIYVNFNDFFLFCKWVRFWNFRMKLKTYSIEVGYIPPCFVNINIVFNWRICNVQRSRNAQLTLQLLWEPTEAHTRRL